MLTKGDVLAYLGVASKPQGSDVPLPAVGHVKEFGKGKSAAPKAVKVRHCITVII